MKSGFTIVLIILIISLIVFLIWNIILYYKVLNGSKKPVKQNLELKYQMQFYVAIFTTIIAVLSFFGYGKIEEIETKVTQDVQNQIQVPLNDIRKNQDRIVFENEMIKEHNSELRSKSEKMDDRFYNLMDRFTEINRELIYSKEELSSQIKNVKNATKDIENVRTDISEIKKIDFLNQVYLVPNLHFNSVTTEMDTVYFTSLTTISKSKLPIFKTPPSIIISNYTGIVITIRDITKDYFTLFSTGSGIVFQESDTYKNNWKYDALIIYKEAK